MKMRSHRLSILIILFLSLANCYFNPLVQTVVSPNEKESDNLFPALSILSLSESSFTVSVSGQLRDNDGATEPNIGLKVISRSSQIDGVDSTATTDIAGRFYMKLSTGTTEIGLTKAGSPYYKFTLSITSPDDIRVTEMNGNPAGVEIAGLVAFDPGNPPSFFELTNSTPANNSTLTNAPSSLFFNFSDLLEIPGGSFSDWFALNILIFPAFSVESVGIAGSTISAMPYGFGSETTTYTILLGPGIRSQSGKTLTPRTVNFTCVSPCSP